MRFKEDFIAPKLEKLDSSAFPTSEFTGDFIAEELKVLGGSNFINSRFSRKFIAPNIEKIELYSFVSPNDPNQKAKSDFKSYEPDETAIKNAILYGEGWKKRNNKILS